MKSGGSVAVSAFSAYFLVRHLTPGMTFDAASGVNHERTVIKDEAGADAEHDLWTGCFTPRELHLLCAAAALELSHLWSVRPGEYGANPVDLDHEELLLIATRPA